MAKRSNSAKSDESLDLRLSLKVNFGDKPGQSVTVMDDQKVHMAGSVFRYRDRIVRFFTVTLFRVAMTTPAVASEFLPGMIYLMRRAGAVIPDSD